MVTQNISGLHTGIYPQNMWLLKKAKVKIKLKIPIFKECTIAFDPFLTQDLIFDHKLISFVPHFVYFMFVLSLPEVYVNYSKLF